MTARPLPPAVRGSALQSAMPLPRVAGRSGPLTAIVVALLAVSLAHAAPQPAWLTSTLWDDYGKGDRVPLPWTPVQCAPNQVSAWGRTYRWTPRSILPSSITSSGAELLRQPMTLELTLDGSRHRVPLDSFTITQQHRTRVTFRASGTVAGITATADMWLEFDGFLWVSLRLEPAAVRGSALQGARPLSSASPSITEARVLATLPADQATLYQTHALALAGDIGREPIPFAWVSDPANNIVNFYHWLGNEDRGLGFTYSTLQGWRPKSRDQFAAILPGPAGPTYVMNLIESAGGTGHQTCPSRAGQPAAAPEDRSGDLSYPPTFPFTFALQATPIKPLPPDWHARMACTQHYAPWKAWLQMPENVDMTLVWPKETGIMPGLDDPYAVNADQMRDVVKAGHDRGVAVLSVAACPQKISHTVKELATYKQDWQVLPESSLDWDGQPQIQNCAGSRTMLRWLFYGWAVENVQEFGLDGLYFDGWQGGSIACNNERHGCGWPDEAVSPPPFREGGRGVGAVAVNRQLTVPILAGREFNKRMCLFLEDHVKSVLPKAAPERPGFPRYHYWIHSWTFVPSVMGFATEWLTGEFAGYPLHGPSMLTPEGTYAKCLGMGLFRARCLSTNWGVPNYFDTLMWEADENPPTDKQTQMAYAWLLPHGVPIGEFGYMNHTTVVELTRLLMRFGTRTARFSPGWRENPYLEIVEPASKDVLVATWDHASLRTGVPPVRGGGGPLLAVVSNLDPDETREVTLRWKGEGGVVFHNARTGEELPCRGGVLKVTLGPESYILLETAESGR